MPTRLLLSLTCLLLAVTLLVPTPDRAQACCMLPVVYEGKIGQAEQKGLLIHRDGVEDLVLGITYEITPDAKGNLPEKLTWLIALPTEPMEEDGYSLAKAGLFDELSDLAYETLVQHLPVPKGNRGVDSLALGEVEPTETADNGIELGRAVTVGPYDIQPVRGVGQNALNGLNTYLKKRGFPVEDPGHMAWFVEYGFTFLCIEVTPKEGETTLSAGEPLPPLRVRFETEYPYYPLRYSSQQGDFDLALYTLTSKPIDLKQSKSVLDAIGWHNQPGRATDFTSGLWKKPQTVSAKDMLFRGLKLESLPKESKKFLTEETRWSFGLFMGKPNPKDRPISDWTGDCFFTLEDQKPAPLATGQVEDDGKKASLK